MSWVNDVAHNHGGLPAHMSSVGDLSALAELAQLIRATRSDCMSSGGDLPG